MSYDFEVIEKAIGPAVEIEESVRMSCMPATLCPMRVTRRWIGSLN